MAGVKGKSGGPRANAGGARPGAGRPRKEVPPVDVQATGDPMAFLEALMDDVGADPRMRLEAAKALMPFKFQKLGEGGKKEKAHDDAKKVAGRFSPSAPPKLIAAGGRKV